tara:strand:+ start:292 stop:510 length:219 start_codon:yes stop_codon:yes gene_type:complete
LLNFPKLVIAARIVQTTETNVKQKIINLSIKTPLVYFLNNVTEVYNAGKEQQHHLMLLSGVELIRVIFVLRH